MSWNQLPEDVRDVIQEVLTVKQLEAFQLECSGLGMMRIARYLEITKGAAVSRIENAHLKLRKAGVRQDESGQWTVGTKEAA